jgi:hypothetical protein
MKLVYSGGDSGRILGNKLELLPGVEYNTTTEDVRYGHGVTVIAEAFALKLVAQGIMSEVLPGSVPAVAPAKVIAPKVEPEKVLPSKD